MPVKLSSKLPAEWFDNGLDDLTARIVRAGQEQAKTGRPTEDGRMLAVVQLRVARLTSRLDQGGFPVPTVEVHRIEPVPPGHDLEPALAKVLTTAAVSRTGRQPALWSLAAGITDQPAPQADPETGEVLPVDQPETQPETPPPPTEGKEARDNRVYLDLKEARDRLCRVLADLDETDRELIDKAVLLIDLVGNDLPQWSSRDGADPSRTDT